MGLHINLFYSILYDERMCKCLIVTTEDEL